MAVGGVDVFAGREIATLVEHRRTVLDAAIISQAGDGRDIDLRTVAEDAVIVVDGRRRQGGQGQGRRRIAIVIFAGRLVAQAGLQAELELIVVGEQLSFQQGVDSVGIFLVVIVVLLVAEAAERIVGGVVDLGDAVWEAQDRIVGVRDIVIGHGHVFRPLELGADVVVLGERRAAVGGVVVEGQVAKTIDAADDIDLVDVLFAFVGRGDFRLRGDQVAIGVGRIGRDLAGGAFDIAHVRQQQEILVHGFDVTRDVGANIIAMVIIRLEVELAAIAEAGAMIVVSAQLVFIDGVAGRGAVVDIAFLDIVDSPAVFLVRRVEDKRERRRVRDPACTVLRLRIAVLHDEALVVEAEAGAEGDFAGCWAAMIVQGLIAAADRGVGKRLGDVGGRARRQFDRTAQAFGVVVRHAGIGDDDAVDGARRDGVVFDGASARARRRAARIGVEQGHAAIGRTVEIGVDAADLDEAALAGVTRQRNAGHAAQRFGGVEVGIFLDGFDRLDADQVRRVLLNLARLDFLARRGRDDNDRVGRRRRLRRGRGSRLRRSGAGEGYKAARRHEKCRRFDIPEAIDHE